MAGRSQHDTRVQREFTRQATSFADSKTLGGAALTAAIVESLGASAAGRILDLAAGPGLVAGALAAGAREVVAIDLTAETLRVARSRMLEEGHENVRLVRANGLGLPFPDGVFDAAVIRLALHHLETPERAVQEAHRGLRAGGVLAVLDLLAPEDPADMPILTALERLRDPSHVLALDENSLHGLLTGAGFEILESRSFRLERCFREWAAIIADPSRMGALEVVMRELARRGVTAGIGLREHGDDLVFDYRFALVTGRR